ncbi:MAG TPA: hypothetical protein VGK19_05860 [Capsulimonadaceae bacterium]|jgi:hypothetical protein
MEHSQFAQLRLPCARSSRDCSLGGLRVYHAAPLHYLPSIFADGALYAKDILHSRRIQPRVTAVKRDHMLGLGEYVHFSFNPVNPLLIDKLTRGYPHAVLVFDAATLLQLPGSAVLPYNTKAWRSKRHFPLVTGGDEAAAFVRNAQATCRTPSMELLVKYGASLSNGLIETRFTTDIEREMFGDMATATGINCPSPCVVVRPAPRYQPVTLWQVQQYYDACAAAGAVIPPPDLPFD